MTMITSIKNYFKRNKRLPIEGQYVRWREGVCPNCGDWMFFDGKLLTCDCGRTLRLIPIPNDAEKPKACSRHITSIITDSAGKPKTIKGKE